MDSTTITVKFRNYTNHAWGSVSCKLEDSGRELRRLICESSGLQPTETKIMWKGKFIDSKKTLSEQKVTDQAKLLLVKGKTEEEEEATQEKLAARMHVDNVIAGANLLADVVDNTENRDDYYFELVNQQGVPVKLDPADRKNLVLAMTLQEQGEKLMQASDKPDLSGVLKFFLESDYAFSKVKDNHYLNCVDNYARLCLDIMWAYLKQDATELLLSNQWRLSRAEEILKKTYNEQTAVLNIRNADAAQAVVYVRLFLLQSLCAHHSRLPTKAATLLNQAQQKIEQMTIPPDLVESLLLLGFDERGLRVMQKNPDAAITWIYQRRERLEENRKKERRERHKKRVQRKYGKTAKGYPLNVDLMEVLAKKLGFEEELVAESLRQTDNDQERAVDLLTSQIDLIRAAVEHSRPYRIKEEDVLQLSIIGPTWSRTKIEAALMGHRGNMENALETLVSQADDFMVENFVDSQTEDGENNGSEEGDEEGDEKELMHVEPTPKTPEQIKAEKDRELKQKAQDEILKMGVGTSDDLTHLDVDLSEELFYCSKIKSLTS